REKLPLVVEGKLQEIPQNHALHTLATMLKKEDGVVDWREPARAIHDHVRAMQPWPGATTKLPDERVLKIVKTRVVDARVASAVERAPGIILVADKSGAIVACGERGEESIALLEAQPEGKRAMRAADLVNGRVLSSGLRLH